MTTEDERTRRMLINCNGRQCPHGLREDEKTYKIGSAPALEEDAEGREEDGETAQRKVSKFYDDDAGTAVATYRICGRQG